MPNNVINDKKRISMYRLYVPVLIALILCGYDYKFYKSNFYLKFASRIYCVFLVSLVLYASIDCCENKLSQKFALIEYCCSVIAALCIKSKSKPFFQKLAEIDIYLRINIRHYYRTRCKIVTFALITWIVRIAYSIMYCCAYVCYESLILYVIRQYSLLALDLNRVWRSLLFEGIRFRLKVLRIRLEENPEDNYYLYVKDCKTIKENKLKFCLYLYRSMADVVDLVSPELQVSLFLSLTGSLPKLVSNIYHMFRAAEGREPMESLAYVIMNLIQISLLLFSPFVIAEFYSAEVEKMRLFLFHRLIDQHNSEDKEDIEIFLRYTDIRTFKYRIFRVIPINMFLPLEMINICINYVIVLINFSHLY